MSCHDETCYEFSSSCLLLVNLAAFAVKDVLDRPILSMVYMVVEEASVG